MRKKVALIIIFGILLLIQPISAQTWTAAKRLTWNTGYSTEPAIATDSNDHIHVVWYDYTPGNEEIFYKRSTNGGVSWSGTKRLTWNSEDSWSPAIATDSNNHIHVVWNDNTPGNSEIYYKKSIDEGATWTTKRLTYNLGSSHRSVIATDSSNNIHVVWNDYSVGNSEIYFKRSTTGGTTWTTKRLTYTSGSSSIPDISVDTNKNIYVVWNDDTPGNEEAYYKKSTDGGATWTTKRLTYNSGSSYSPAIAVDSNNHIHVVWWDDTPGNQEIYYKRSTNGGVTWTAKRLTYTSGGSFSPVIAVDSNNHLHLVFVDTTPGNSEIYYKKSTNGGTTWATKRLTHTSGSSYTVAIAIDSSNDIHVVWTDDTPGNQEIYYRKGNQ